MCYTLKMKAGLRVLTLNCWGLLFLTPDKNRRIDAITATIKKGNWDVVALDRVWLKGDRNRRILNGYLKTEERDMELEALYGLVGISKARNLSMRSDKRRVDHIICGATHGEHEFKFFSPKLVFRQTFSGERIPFSDHHGVSVVI